MKLYKAVLLFSFLVLIGCRTKKMENRPDYAWSADTPQGAFVETLTRYDNDTTAYMKAMGYITIDENTVKGRLQIRWRRDKAIQISILPAIVGVELCRVVLTTDSIHIIDRYHKNYMAESMAKLQREFPFEFSFASIQSMLLASPFIPGGKTTAKDVERFVISESDNMYRYMYAPERPAVDYTFVCDKQACLESVKMKSASSSRQITCRYVDYVSIQDRYYPQCLGWIIEGFLTRKMVLTFDKIVPEWNMPQNISYSVSSRYNKIPISSWLKMII